MDAPTIKQFSEELTHKDFDIKFIEMHYLIKEIDKTSKETKEQAKTTNGRVKKLELWRMFMMGAITVLIGLFGMLGFMMQELFHKLALLDNFDSRVAAAVDQRLADKYEIRVIK